ncbi:YciI family protein [Actinocrispum sp. NPDC049592]|uniref:YciI family protein n=1 Tax=Actinocrispum sp. NPDC049592 TaxID=3154835 RepID=UPI0034451F0A
MTQQQYLLSIYQPDGPIPEPDVLAGIKAELDVLNREMKDAGVWVFSAGLTPPSSATVLKARGRDVLVTDGPFTEGKEHLGGFTIIRAADLDEAMGWGSRLAGVLSPLSIEIRPFQG